MKKISYVIGFLALSLAVFGTVAVAHAATGTGTITASANPCTTFVNNQCSTTISWSTTNIPATAQVWVSQDGVAGDKVFATGVSGSQVAPWITANNGYVFTLYKTDGNTVHPTSSDILASVHVKTPYVAPSGKILSSISTCRSSASNTPCTANISWTTKGLPNQAQVWVNVDGGVQKLFASGLSGSQSAPWVKPGHTYTFTLYRSADYNSAFPTGTAFLSRVVIAPCRN